MEVIEIIDNFLPENIFYPLQNLMNSSTFPWYFNDTYLCDVENTSLDNYQFTHSFFGKVWVESVGETDAYSSYNELLLPIIDKLKVKKIEKVKANLNPRTSTHIEGGYHIDMENVTTSILYMNTNNGWTEIQGGGKIDCVENRAVTFNSNLMHSGYTCTDQKRKIVINFNYGTN